MTTQALTTFSFESNQIRVVNINIEPWFVAVDVCRALGIANPSDALKRLDDDETQVIDSSTLDSNEGIQINNLNMQLSIINESGLYSLVLGSRKPEAKRFKKWVTSEVLPSIRKTGQYKAPGRTKQPSRLTTINQAIRVAHSATRLFKAWGYDEENCVIGANNLIRKETDGEIDIKDLAELKLIAKVQEQTLTPTDIANRTGMNVRLVNVVLCDLELQNAHKDLHGHRYYELTDKGKQYGEYEITGKKHSNGTPIRQVKWFTSVINLVKDYVPMKNAKDNNVVLLNTGVQQ
jgi:prophage antirepressor-like protein/predicted transcriptional regulator